MAWRIRKDDRVREIYALLLPGIGGAAILQVNILVSRVFAFQAAADGASLVYLANRLMELPLGVFTISVTTVVFPALSKLAAVGDGSGFREQFLQGFRLILAIMLPAAIGLALLAEPVVRLLFEWGAFDATDTLKAAPLVIIYASGLPFYALATLLVRGFHARGDMKTPLRVSAWNLGINVVASLGLVGPLGVEGLALANVLAAAIQCSLLGFRLWPSVSPPRRAWVRELSELLKIQAGCVLLIAAVGAGWLGLDSVLRSGWAGGGAGVMDTVDPKWLAGLRMGVLVPLGAAVYLLSLWLLRFRDFGKMLRPVRIKQGA
jgi:putative peptidoglycan lipid II flippase